MPIRSVALLDQQEELQRLLRGLRARLGIDGEFPVEVVASAERAVASPRLPELDRTDLELITIDPPGARDLDQALHIARRDQGYLVSYAIADVGAFVSEGDPMDLEAHRRGVTLYAPDRKIALYPPVLSEGGASLLAGEVRPALLWTVQLDGDGRLVEAGVVRARVRSREQLDYGQAQSEIDGPAPREVLRLLAEVGALREARELERGGVSLQIPAQEVYRSADGWALRYRANLAVEGWNAQISLLTGIAAAGIMLAGRVGALRTLPPADRRDLRRLRAMARALHVTWPTEWDYPEFVRSLDPNRPDHAAMLNACATLFRGAGYSAFEGNVPEQAEHAALATEYAHVTAPLRRLVDRYTGETCLALVAGAPVPEWVRRGLGQLPAEMSRADQAAKRYERAVIDLVEALLLRDRVGEAMLATVVEVGEKGDRGEVVIKDPAVTGRVRGQDLPLGHEIEVRLVSADPDVGSVEFAVA